MWCNNKNTKTILMLDIMRIGQYASSHLKYSLWSGDEIHTSSHRFILHSGHLSITTNKLFVCFSLTECNMNLVNVLSSFHIYAVYFQFFCFILPPPLKGFVCFSWPSLDQHQGNNKASSTSVVQFPIIICTSDRLQLSI